MLELSTQVAPPVVVLQRLQVLAQYDAFVAVV